MTKRERLEAERDRLKGYVELFERKYKNFDTGHHKALKRVEKALAKMKPHKEIKKKADLGKGVNDG